VKTLHDIIRDRLLVNVVATEQWPKADGSENIDKDTMTDLQWGEDWLKILDLMKNRMEMGGYRYDPHRNQRPGQFDNVADAKRRLDLHDKDGNMEHLLDAANITILACLKKAHKKFHFTSIDDGVHAEKIK
jgi:hypothetical protein